MRETSEIRRLKFLHAASKYFRKNKQKTWRWDSSWRTNWDYFTAFKTKYQIENIQGLPGTVHGQSPIAKTHCYEISEHQRWRDGLKSGCGKMPVHRQMNTIRFALENWVRKLRKLYVLAKLSISIMCEEKNFFFRFVRYTLK